jgi:hypothetical protein
MNPDYKPKHTGRIGIHTSEETLARLRYQSGIRSTRELVDELLEWVAAEQSRLAEFRQHYKSAK